MEKTYRTQKEKFHSFFLEMKGLQWWPENASFQLSDGKKYGRHMDWVFKDEVERKHIANAVWDRYHLALALDDGFHAYFLQPWERTRLVDFLGDIEET